MDLDRLLADFVQEHSSGMQQRDANWYASMGVTVGGSELAAIMGRNSYSSFYDVVESKLAVLAGASSWAGGGEACWWGTLFEDVISAFVEADLGSPARGGDICIQKYPGHRNSPDGYIVARIYREGDDEGRCGGDGEYHIWTTDMDPGTVTSQLILLLEFKCPMRRKPCGEVPRQYVPQVWSGLAVSPVAHLGLFVDAVFRKCGLDDLGDTPDYDVSYHRGDRGAWDLPVAWGLIGVYAPRRAADDAAADDAERAARQIHLECLGMADYDNVVDLGDMEPRLFARALGLIDRKQFPVCRGAACFADGRGAALRTGRDVAVAVEAFRAGAPAAHWLMGILPWKLFEVDYVAVPPRPGFMEEVAPLIAEVHRTVAEARAAPDPAAYMRTARRLAPRPGAPPTSLCEDGRPPGLEITQKVIQDLFDCCN